MLHESAPSLELNVFMRVTIVVRVDDVGGLAGYKSELGGKRRFGVLS